MLDMNTFKAGFAFLDFVLLTAFALLMGFNSNTRIFAFITHVYFMMTFFNPGTVLLSLSPSLAVVYGTIVCGASCVVFLAFLLPRPITALAEAESLAAEVGPGVGLLVDLLPLVTSELARDNVQSALGELTVVLEDLKVRLRQAWLKISGSLGGRIGAGVCRRTWSFGWMVPNTCQLPCTQQPQCHEAKYNCSMIICLRSDSCVVALAL
jgi:hypothetical protein